jgi:hypothetical protein
MTAGRISRAGPPAGRPRRTRRRLAALLLGCGLGVSGLAGALAQEAEEGGLFARIDLAAGIRAETGQGSDDETTARAGLAFGIDSVTRSQIFRFRAGADLEFDRDGADLARPEASLSYVLASRATELGLDLAYRESDLDRTRADEIDSDDEILARGGRRTSASAALRLITGREAPFGTQTRLSWSQRDYADTTDPDLFASTTLEASTVLRFEIDPAVTLRLTASLSQREDEDSVSTEKTTTRLGAGATVALDRAWTLELDAIATTITTERDSALFGLRTRTETDGLDAQLKATRALRNGTLSFRLGREVETTGSRTTLELARALELKEGTLSGTLGLVRFETGTLRPVATLSLSRALTPTSTLSASLTRSAAVSDDDEDILRTRLSLALDQEIDARSRWSASMGLAEVEVVDGTGDQRRIDLGLGYRRQLTRDWDLSADLSHRLTWEDGAREDSITTLSLNVARSFVFRP